MTTPATTERTVSCTHHIDASVLTVVYLVVPYYRVAVGANLYSGEGITVDIVVLDEAPPLTEDIHAALVAIVDLVFPVDSKHHEVVHKTQKLNHAPLRSGPVLCRITFVPVCKFLVDVQVNTDTSVAYVT